MENEDWAEEDIMSIVSMDLDEDDQSRVDESAFSPYVPECSER